MAGHHIRVALNNDHLARFSNVFLGQIEPVKHSGLVIHRGFRGIQILRALVVVVKLPGPKTNRCPRDIADGPDQSAAEAVIGAPVTLGHKSGLSDLSDGESRSGEFLRQGVIRLWCIAHTKPLSRKGIKASLPQEDATFLSIRGSQLAFKELFGQRVSRQQAGSITGVSGLTPFFVMKGVADGSRQPFDGFLEANVVHLLQERVYIPAFTTPEAVIETRLASNMETRAALVVKRAQALHGTDASGLERHILAD